ncbi:uncharacterized protein LOC116259002 isoform X3 [Nymphaea colorata]|uniref:uncharacterized protein LOC116259002 isoform X3 n=1 Tax=Nymphaea colorata TaxID=210225 RepID=UPI00129EA267|nr:uncharacterized protein LOC116259002 isoform X3 [Nymphaea colorata]
MQYRGAGGLVDPVLGFSGNENGGNAKLPPTSGAGMTSASFAVINLRASASATKKTGQFVIQLQAVSSFAAPILIISHLTSYFKWHHPVNLWSYTQVPSVEETVQVILIGIIEFHIINLRRLSYFKILSEARCPNDSFESQGKGQ